MGVRDTETTAFHMQEPGNFSTKNVIEDFMKTEYQEGLRNEFNMMDALINRLPKDTITGKKKYKSFALGVADNVRAVGNSYDRYELGFESFYNKGVETVEAEFDTTKLMATFAITDEAILKGTGDGSLLDVLKDSLDRMEVSLKHTMNRFTYGAPNGKIGTVTSASLEYVNLNEDSEGNEITNENEKGLRNASAKPTDPRGAQHNIFYGDAQPCIVRFKMKNSHSLLPGMGIMIEDGDKRYVGRIWQKDNSTIHDEVVVMFIDKYLTKTGSTWSLQTSLPTDDITVTAAATVYSRQLDDTGRINNEYHGLEAILNPTEYPIIFGVNRNIYTSLKNTEVDLKGEQYLSEEVLRDVSDHMSLTSPDGTAINLVCSNHRIISQVEKSLMQFKEAIYTQNSNGYQLGRPDIKFDNFVLVKDKYARDENVYMLDQGKIGELVRRDFTWITSGEVNSVLQRRPGTELYEGIMNKYADMYIDAWRCHGIIKRCKVAAAGTAIRVPEYAREVKVVNTVTTKADTDTQSV